MQQKNRTGSISKSESDAVQRNCSFVIAMGNMQANLQKADRTIEDEARSLNKVKQTNARLAEELAKVEKECAELRRITKSQKESLCEAQQEDDVQNFPAQLDTRE